MYFYPKAFQVLGFFFFANNTTQHHTNHGSFFGLGHLPSENSHQEIAVSLMWDLPTIYFIIKNTWAMGYKNRT